MTDDAYPDALAVGQQLPGYVLERVLGQGGFGITYLARDRSLDRPVAIKEYMPGEVAQRRADATVRPRTGQQGERYQWGLERFITEAKTLARFDHPNIVRVYSVFEHNNTAYMAMRYEEGENLAVVLEQRGTLVERELLSILMPILDGLERVHQAGFIHRDIKPENIYLRRDGSPVLLDFGSARQSLGRSRTMTILVAPGYAPLEQYYGDPETQGAWTDIYSLGATCYRAIAGRAPMDAIARTKGVLGSAREALVPTIEVGRGRYTDRLLAAVDHALKLSERDRPQTIESWRKELSTPSVAQKPGTEGGKQSQATVSTPPPSKSMPFFWAAGGAIVAAAAIGVFLKVESGTRSGDARSIELAANRSDRAGTNPATPTAPLKASPENVGVSIRPASAVPTAIDVARGENEPAESSPVLEQKVTTVPREPATLVMPRPEVTKVMRDAGNTRRDAAGDSARATIRPTHGEPTRTTAIASGSDNPAQTSKGEHSVTNVPLVTPPIPVPSFDTASKAPPVEAVIKLAVTPQLDAAQRAIEQADYANALRILKPLAHTGQARAQLLYANLLAAGHGLRQDINEAYIWASLAARRGSADAAARKNQLASLLQPAEIRQADRIVDAWQARPLDNAASTQ